MAKLFGYPINLEPEGVGGGSSSINAEASRSNGAATSSSAGFPQRESNPRFPESGSSAPMDSESDPNNILIDFFSRESHEIQTSGEEFDTWRNQIGRDVNIFDLMEEDGEEFELILGFGSRTGSGQPSRGDDSVTGDNNNKGVGSGRVESVTDLNLVVDDDDVVFTLFEDDDLFCDEEEMLIADELCELENSLNEITCDLEPVQSIPVELEEEEEEEDEEEEEEEEEEEDEEDEEEEEEEGVEMTIPSRTELDQDIDNMFDGLFEGIFDDFYGQSAEDMLRDAMEVDGEFYRAIFPEPGDDVFAQPLFNQAPPPPIVGTRPASKKVVDGLPVVEITSEDLSSACAICIGDFVVEEKVTRLPCWHYYHGECIVPWLGMKNTCPVCRFELPTDE